MIRSAGFGKAAQWKPTGHRLGDEDPASSTAAVINSTGSRLPSSDRKSRFTERLPALSPAQ